MKKFVLSLVAVFVLIWCGAPLRAQYNKEYFYWLGRQMMMQNDYHEAIRTLNTLLRFDQTAYEGYFLRGIAKYNLNDLLGADEDFTIAISKNPVFTKVKGRQVSETTTRTIVEESAFGEASVREVKNTRKDYVITWAAKEPYVWDDESTMTAQQLIDAMAAREVHLAETKKRQDEYKASKNQAPGAFNAAGGMTYNF